MATDMRSLLETPMDEIKRPPPLPAGTYHGVISGHEFGESKNRKTPYVRYGLSLLSAGEDVEASLLDGIDLSKRKPHRDYYLTPDALYRVKEFLQSVGVETEGRPLGQCIPEALNARVIISVTQRQSEDGKDIFNDIGDVVGEE